MKCPECDGIDIYGVGVQPIVYYCFTCKISFTVPKNSMYENTPVAMRFKE